MTAIIELERFRTKGAKIFTGRDRGKSVRERSNIDKLENENEIVTFIVPKEIYSINPSFFEELFVNVVKKLGKQKFYNKFKFINEGTYDFETPLNEAISRILRKTTALD